MCARGGRGVGAGSGGGEWGRGDRSRRPLCAAQERITSHPNPNLKQEMMVSCKAGQGCGEMCVTGELMHVHADEQAIGM